MANHRKMLNFRCPVDVLEAVDAIGREHYPANNDNGCDRSKTLLDIIQAGIAALTNGDVVIDVKQPSKTSKTELDLEAIEELVKNLIAENSPVIQPRLTDNNTYVRRYELTQKIDDRIVEALGEDGLFFDSYAFGMIETANNQINEINRELQELKAAVPPAVVPNPQPLITNDQLTEGEDGERQTPDPSPITNAQSPITSSQLPLGNDEELQPTSITEEKVEEEINLIPQNEPTSITDKEFILSLLPIGDILAGEQFTGTSLISQGVGIKMAENQRVVEMRFGLTLSESSLTDERYIMREFKKILLALGCEIEHKQIKRKVTYWIKNPSRSPIHYEPVVEADN